MRILAIDYGEARTGLALSDFTGTIATPLTVLTDRNTDWLIKRITDIVTEHEVGEIVVGNPLNMDGTIGEKSVKCSLFAEKLQISLKLPVNMFDERLSTVKAHEIRRENNSRRKKRSSPIDAVAAAVILQSYLEHRGNKMS
jgi:putative Holliday junction resolvase